MGVKNAVWLYALSSITVDLDYVVFQPIQAEQLVLEFFPQKITELNNALKASHCAY